MKFLGWDRPGLLSACEHVLAFAKDPQEINLSGVAVVVPGGRVGRHLRSLLVQQAASKRCPLSPPMVITPGGIAETLLGVEGPFANAAACRLAWAEALLEVPEARLLPLVPRPPSRDNLPAWLAMGDMLQRCHTELCAGLILFREVPDRCTSGGGAFLEQDRWEAAAAVQDGYRRILERRGLKDLDLARIDALRGAHPGERATPELDVVLLGVSELSAMARASLALAGDRVTCLVFADESSRDRFDELGCPLEAAWSSQILDVRDDQIVFADSPADQADRALQAIAKLGGVYAADQVAIGVVDEEVVPFLERRAEAVGGAGLRYAGGTPVKRTGPWRMLAAIAEHLQRQDFASLQSLVRHPDLELWLRRRLSGGVGEPPPEWWLSEMDAYAAESFHATLSGVWHTRDPELAGLLAAVHRAVESLLAPLLESSSSARRSADKWAEPMLGVLASVYEARSADEASRSDRLLMGGCHAVRAAIEDLRSLGGTGGSGWPEVTAAEALQLVMAQVGDQGVPDEPDAAAIEMLGWLELPLDPSEAVVVVGFNDGRIPASFVGDPFLSERLRVLLGVSNGRQRYARDAYVLASLPHSRRSLTLVSGRRTAAGDPMWPSRLVFACRESDLAMRIRRCLGKAPEPAGRVRLIERLKPGPASRFPIAPIANTPVVNSMSVTSFGRYISSPYLFYLRDVLRLGESGEHHGELDPMAFGGLVHHVMERFARSSARHSTDARRIEECLLDELADRARSCFGDTPRAAIDLQMEVVRRRLRGVAQWQAARARDGWLIAEEPEWTPSTGSGVLMVDGQPMGLRGRIDRIERHSGTGRLAILDFKTGERAETPDKAHRKSGQWVGLQLPLYRHLAAELGADNDTVLGYVVIPREITKVAFLQAEWTHEDLAHADAKAFEVVRAVREGRFGEIGEGAEEGSVFAALCGGGFLGAGDDSVDDQGEDQ